MKLDQKGKIMAEYVWIDAVGETRSKSRVSCARARPRVAMARGPHEFCLAPPPCPALPAPALPCLHRLPPPPLCRLRHTTRATHRPRPRPDSFRPRRSPGRPQPQASLPARLLPATTPAGQSRASAGGRWRQGRGRGGGDGGTAPGRPRMPLSSVTQARRRVCAHPG